MCPGLQGRLLVRASRECGGHTAWGCCCCAEFVQIKREVEGGSHAVFEAFLHGREDNEHHKALKMLRLSELRQLQREVSVCGCRNTHQRRFRCAGENTLTSFHEAGHNS